MTNLLLDIGDGSGSPLKLPGNALLLTLLVGKSCGDTFYELLARIDAIAPGLPRPNIRQHTRMLYCVANVCAGIQFATLTLTTMCACCRVAGDQLQYQRN